MARVRKRKALQSVDPSELKTADLLLFLGGWQDPVRGQSRALKSEAQFHAFLTRYGCDPHRWSESTLQRYDLAEQLEEIAGRIDYGDDPRSGPKKKLAPTLGPWVCAWIECFLVHSQGDYLGQPFHLIDFHRRFIYRAYELHKDGARKHKQGLLGLPKGNAKTEIAAALGLAELSGPVRCSGFKKGKPIPAQVVSPDIPIGAASYDQANELFGASGVMIKEGPLEPYFEVYEKAIYPRSGHGRMYRVAAEAGTNDGKRPTFFEADELHEWTGRKERVHLVLSNGRAKRADSWELGISTAGWDTTSLLGRLYSRGKRIQAGDEPEGHFLFEWLEASQHWDLSDPDQLRKAIRECNPGSGIFLSVEDIAAKFSEIPEHEFRRYFLNQWTAAPERWEVLDHWDDCEDSDRVVSKETPIAIGFDGSWSGDSTAIVGSTIEPVPHQFLIGAWEKPEGVTDWHVDIPDVEQSLRDVCADRNVKIIGCDPHRWQRSLALLEAEGLPIIKWPSHSAAVMAPACQQFERAVKARELTHDGDERVKKHMANCIVKIDSKGPRITKDHKDSIRKIDIAVAMIIAHDLAFRNVEQESIYSSAETAVM